MNRYAIIGLFGIEGLNIAWYGLIIGFGMLLGLLLASRRARARGFKPDLIGDFFFLALPLAIVGARLYFVLFKWENYKDNLIKILAVNEGGLAIYGGVIGGFLAAVIFCMRNKFSLLTLVDLVVPSLVLGQAVGRWGNFINQEAFGNVIADPKYQFFPVAVYIESLGEWHQATFFYESAWNAVLFCVLLLLSRKRAKDGILLSAYFMGYGLGRFLIEGLRTDSLYLVPGLRVSQLLSLVLIAAGGVLAFLIHKSKVKAGPYEGKYALK